MSWLSNAVKSPRGITDENQIFSHGQVQSRKPHCLRWGTSQENTDENFLLYRLHGDKFAVLNYNLNIHDFELYIRNLIV
jgi:hypothetical protein